MTPKESLLHNKLLGSIILALNSLSLVAHRFYSLFHSKWLKSQCSSWLVLPGDYLTPGYVSGYVMVKKELSLDVTCSLPTDSSLKLLIASKQEKSRAQGRGDSKDQVAVVRCECFEFT
jgi:hypothetical protein